MKKFVITLLTTISRKLLKKYRPQVVGITGSVGKTSAKQAIAVVLARKFNVRANEKNYNNELGVPLTIIGAKSGGKSPVHWAGVILWGWWQLLITNKNYPEILVLEMGADHPGDITFLTALAPCNVGVVTAIGEAHYEFFRELESIIREKQIIITHLQKDGMAVLNIDNNEVRGIVGRTHAQVMTYGFSEDATVFGHDEAIEYEGEGSDRRPIGTRFKISFEGATIPLYLPHVLGRSHALAALAGVAVGIRYGVNLIESAEALESYEPQPGRMAIIPGIKRTTIIDDTYNASPLAMVLALDTLRSVEIAESAERFAVLGNMLELGELTESAHYDIGMRIGAFDVDYLVCVGEHGKMIAKGAADAGFPEHRIARFDSSDEVGTFLKEQLEEGDVMLCKGSQGARMEKVVKALMADPMAASELLCRQGAQWMD